MARTLGRWRMAAAVAFTLLTLGVPARANDADALLQASHRLEKYANLSLHSLACIAVPYENGEPARPFEVRIFITEASERPLAARLATKAHLENLTSVRVIPRRFRIASRQRVLRRLRETAPSAEIYLGPEAARPIGRCPRAVILLPTGTPDAADLAWARSARSRFGSDRVVIQIARAGQPVPH
jgi:hypothetical protein